MRKGTGRIGLRGVVRRVTGIGCALTSEALASVWARSDLDPDPCAHVYGQTAVGACWAREADRAEDEMNRVYLAARQGLPKHASKSLEKAQEHWLEFRDAHLQTLYGVESPTKTWGRDYPICLSMSRVALTRERTRELLRVLEPAEEALCPL